MYTYTIYTICTYIYIYIYILYSYTLYMYHLYTVSNHQITILKSWFILYPVLPPCAVRSWHAQRAGLLGCWRIRAPWTRLWGWRHTNSLWSYKSYEPWPIELVGLFRKVRFSRVKREFIEHHHLGKLTIKWAMFNRKLLNYRRVPMEHGDGNNYGYIP